MQEDMQVIEIRACADVYDASPTDIIKMPIHVQAITVSLCIDIF